MIPWLFPQDGTAQNFRYQVLPKTLATIFNPKKIEQSVDKMNMRATMFGGLFFDNFDKLPRTDAARVCWEATETNNCLLFCIITSSVTMV